METVGDDSSVRCTKTRNGSGNGSPSCWETEGFSRSKRDGSCVQAGTAVDVTVAARNQRPVWSPRQ